MPAPERCSPVEPNRPGVPSRPRRLRWLWATLNFMSTCLLVVVIVRLHKYCGYELERIELATLNRMDASMAAAGAEGESVVERHRARMEVAERLRAVDASPIAVSSLLLVAASIAVQVGGIVIQIWGRWG